MITNEDIEHDKEWLSIITNSNQLLIPIKHRVDEDGSKLYIEFMYKSDDVDKFRLVHFYGGIKYKDGKFIPDDPIGLVKKYFAQPEMHMDINVYESPTIDKNARILLEYAKMLCEKTIDSETEQEVSRMVNRRTWEEFRDTGLLLLINQFLHIFGWAIVVTVDSGKVTECYPARVRFRGFGSESVSKAYRKISKYMKENAEELEIEANE